MPSLSKEKTKLITKKRKSIYTSSDSEDEKTIVKSKESCETKNTKINIKANKKLDFTDSNTDEIFEKKDNLKKKKVYSKKRPIVSIKKIDVLKEGINLDIFKNKSKPVLKKESSNENQKERLIEKTNSSEMRKEESISDIENYIKNSKNESSVLLSEKGI